MRYVCLVILVSVGFGCATLQNKIGRETSGDDIIFTGVFQDDDDNRAILVARATAYTYVREECRGLPRKIVVVDGEAIAKPNNKWLGVVRVSVNAEECDEVRKNPAKFKGHPAEELLRAYGRAMGLLQGEEYTTLAQKPEDGAGRE